MPVNALFKLSASWSRYEDLRPTKGQSLTWMQPEGTTRAVVLTQKESVFRRVAPGLAELSIATCLVPYPTPNRKAVEAIGRVGGALRAPLFWFGDLDPIGLTAFELLRERISVRYAGIDDRWLASVERVPSEKHRALTAMGEEERQHFEQLAGFVKDLRKLTGAHGFDLLASGKKLEVEGLMTISPAFLRRTPSALARRIRAHG